MSAQIHETLPLGVVIERKSVENRWIRETWRPVAVIPGAPALAPAGEWTLIEQGEGGTRYHAGTLELELFRKETEGYKVNLSQHPPRVFVVLRTGEDADSTHDYVPVRVTVCPYEAQDYLDSGEDLVETVTMPEGVIGLVQDFIDRHHVDEPFYKRKRRPHDPRKMGFAGGVAPVDRPRDGTRSRRGKRDE